MAALKQQVTANRLDGDIEELVAAVHEFFGGFTAGAALRLTI